MNLRQAKKIYRLCLFDLYVGRKRCRKWRERTVEKAYDIWCWRRFSQRKQVAHSAWIDPKGK